MASGVAGWGEQWLTRRYHFSILCFLFSLGAFNDKDYLSSFFRLILKTFPPGLGSKRAEHACAAAILKLALLFLVSVYAFFFLSAEARLHGRSVPALALLHDVSSTASYTGW